MMDPKTLIKEAYAVQKQAYAPYSDFCVGAALLAKSGRIYSGCNVENAAYTPTNCAERTAFFKAVSEGEREFAAIAIVGNHRDRTPDPEQFCAPCGVCLQVMAEFCDPEQFQVVLANSPDRYRILKLKELLPYGFSLSGSEDTCHGGQL